MKTLLKKGWFPGALAFVVAITIAFAFTRPVKSVSADPQQGSIWIKYDCGRSLIVYEDQPNTLPGNQEPNSGLFSKCQGDKNLCARLYNFAQTSPVGGNPAIRRPNAGATILDQRFCTVNTTP